MFQSILFLIIAGIAIALASWQFSKIRRNILLGKAEKLDTQVSLRLKNMFLVAFGQQKMFKRFVPAILHLFIYIAFLFTQIELIEIFIDGIFGVHRYFAPVLGGFYTFIINFIEILSLLALIATIAFLARRNALRLPRFHNKEMLGWPKLDGNLILFLEIALIFAIFTMNGSDVLLQQIDPSHYPDTGTLYLSSFVGNYLILPLINGVASVWDAITITVYSGEAKDNLVYTFLVIAERKAWWLHVLVVFAFLNYLPISKHLHVVLAFFNTYFAKLNPRGQMQNMPEIMNEVKVMMGLAEDEGGEMSDEMPDFGAKDIFDLSWINLLNAYTCTECGRCTSVCPANITGKKLSPRKIMMDIRDRADEVGKRLDSGDKSFAKDKKQALSAKNYDDGKSLFDYISKEEIHACTTCNACVEACPVMINPLEPILQLRRYEILTESSGPADWIPMFNAIEGSGAVWEIPDARDKWVEDM